MVGDLARKRHRHSVAPVPISHSAALAFPTHTAVRIANPLATPDFAMSDLGYQQPDGEAAAQQPAQEEDVADARAPGSKTRNPLASGSTQ